MKGTSCCHECRAIWYCYFVHDTKNLVTQALLRCLPSTFHFVICHHAYAHLFASVPLASDVLQGHVEMKGTSCCNDCPAIAYFFFFPSRGGKRNSVTQAWLQCLLSAFHCEVLRKKFLRRYENVHVTLGFTLGSAVLQSHAGLRLVALRFPCEV